MRFLGKLVLLVIVVAVAIGGWTVFAGQGKSSASKANLVLKDEKTIYQRLGAIPPNFYFDDYGITRIFGSIKNSSPDECSYVKLEIKVRDKSNKLLKTLDVTVKDIAAGGVKSYDINGGTLTEGIELEGKILEAGFSKR